MSTDTVTDTGIFRANRVFVFRANTTIYDNKLNWSKMASEVASRGRQALGFLKRLGGLISKKDLSTIYECKDAEERYFISS